MIDKNLCAGISTTALKGYCLVIAIVAGTVYAGWGLPGQPAIGETTPQDLAPHNFTPGSMAPMVKAACEFALATGKRAVDGQLNEIEVLLPGTAGMQAKRSRLTV